MVFRNFLDNPRAEVTCLDRAHRCLVVMDRSEVLNVLLDAYLLPHDALDVNPVGVVIIFDQRCLDGLLETLGVYGELFVGNQSVYLIFRLSFLRWARLLDSDLFPTLVNLILFQVVSFGDDFAVASRRWEPAHILVDFVAKDVRVLAEKGLCAHNFHRHDRVELTLQFFTRFFFLFCF